MLVEQTRRQKTLRAGIVGAGYVAAHHLRAARDLGFVDIVGIVDPDVEKAQALAAKYPGASVYSNLDGLREVRPDVVHILTPPALHKALAVEALGMGCHVLVEKPMAEDAVECDAMIASARANGKVLSVNHSARFDPVVLEAAEAVRNGVCGDVLAVHFLRSSDYPPYAGGPLPAPYRQGSYPFRDLGVHGLYLLELFLGPARDLRVRWDETGRDPLLTFDEWRAEADCERGTGYMFLSWNTRPIQNELFIHGTKAVIHVDCFLQTCQISKTLPGPKQIGMVINGTINAAKKSVQVPWNMVRFATGGLKPSPGIYRAVQDFYKALAAGTPPPVAPEEGRRVMALISEKCQEADEAKRLKLVQQAQQLLEPARVLVTGGAGFLGSALVERLTSEGESVRLLLRRPLKAPRDGVSVVYGSLGQPDVVDHAFQGVDVVYHVGAAMKGGPAEFEQGTIWGTRNVVESCLKHGVKKLVYVSSLSVLDHAGHQEGTPVTESSPFEPFPRNRGAYTQTKLEAERIVREAVENRGLRAVILRPGQIFGPGAEKVTPNGVIGIAGRWLLAGNGRRKLPLIFRDDVVDALLAASQREEALGQVIHLVDTTAIDQNEYLAAAKTKLDGTPVWRVPLWFLMLMSFGVELLCNALKRGAPLSRYKIRSLRPLGPFDVTKAQQLLGWKPRTGVSEGLRLTFGAK